ncbi:hypothetical protein FG379_001964 [Cryptosporidium bovis]|uniref:uncharacterized protein n=1 Tax=Cryptosporidium bovis TaxID=310047 RepID=UPI00351A4BA6|nr:hypothetical protein FG379_001964 [Cryptosporidium bovis]
MGSKGFVDFSIVKEKNNKELLLNIFIRNEVCVEFFFSVRAKGDCYSYWIEKFSVKGKIQ